MRFVSGVLALLGATSSLAQDPGVSPAASPPATVAAPATAAADQGPVKPGDAEAGAAKVAACGACHGMDGNSIDPQYPKLAGQHELYTARHLHLFKSGSRPNPIMLGFAATLSAQDMRDIGAFYASKSTLPGVADEQLYARGEQLYRGGDKNSRTPACMACHGPTGRGNPGAAFPALAGQHADYTKTMLQMFRDGTVFGTEAEANRVMAGVAAFLSDADIEALATYIEGLHDAEATAAPIATSSP
jgi:cytochrome c553